MRPRTSLDVPVMPTRRGLTVTAVAAGGVWMGMQFGARSLNAIVVPALVALIGAAVSLQTLDSPSVERSPPSGGFPGDGGTVTLSFSADGQFAGVVHDELPDGLGGDTRTETLVGADPVTYEVTYERRGVHAIGPARVTARDVLGLMTRTFTLPERTSVVVYPTVRAVPTRVTDRVTAGATERRHHERDEFDHLREYARGDALRDVHWATTAKRDDLVVREYRPSTETPTVSVAASAEDSASDAMAEATASLCAALLSEGLSVTLWTPDGRLELEPDEQRRLLEHLARVGSGDAGADADARADVVVHAGQSGTSVRLGDERLAFETLTGTETGRAPSRPTGHTGVQA